MPISSLRLRLFMLATAVLLPAFALILYSTFEQRILAIQNTHDDSLHLLKSVAAEQKQVFTSIQQELIILAQLPAVRHPGSWGSECDRTLADLLKQHPQYTNLGVIDLRGEVRCSALPFPGRVNASDKLYFRRATESEKFAIGDYQIGRITGKPSVNFGYPVHDAAGKIEAVVFIALDITSWFNQMVTGMSLPQGATLTIVDNLGTTLAHFPDPEQWVDNSRPDASIIKTILARAGGGTSEEIGMDGIKRLYTYAPLYATETSRIYVYTGVPSKTVFAGVNQAFVRNLSAMVVVTLLALMAAWVGSQIFVLRPVKILIDATQRLAKGDLRTRTGLPHTNGELGHLAEAFDDMAHSLEQNDIELRETERARQQSERRFSNIVSTAADAIISVDRKQRITQFNSDAETIFGYSASEILGQPLEVLLPERYRETHQQHMQNFSAAPEISRLMGKRRELWGLRKDGTEFPAEASISKLLENGDATFTTILRDITTRKQAEEAISRLAYYDPLTGFPNRTAFRDQVRQAIAAGLESRQPVALLLMDLERFKEVNETLGHVHGDSLLRQVGQRLHAMLFDRDIIARLGGDEFGILLPRLTATEDVGIVIKKIHGILESPFMIEGLPIAVEVGIGVAIAPDHATDTDGLLQKADVAMYQAKRSGSGHVVYSPEQDPHSPQRLSLMAELRDAIEQDQLTLHYQPKIDLQTGRPVANEALVRWRHPQKGVIPPDQFIGIAEHTGLIKPLTQWVLNAALRQCQACRREGILLRVGVNLSARSLHDPLLPNLIADSLETAGAMPEQLELEITESAVIFDPVHTLENLSALHRMGVLLSIDDFGTGYTSLGHLKQLPVHEIKIDKSFVLGILKNENDATIVRSIIELSHNLGFKVVAEGVEDKNTLDKLTEMKCDFAQGYHICRPSPVDEFKRWYVTLQK